MNLETKITIYKFTPQVFTLTRYLICLFDLLLFFFIICILLLLLPQIYYLKEGIYETPFPVV